MHANDRRGRRSQGLLGVTGKRVEGRSDKNGIHTGTVIVQQQLICTPDTW